MIIPIGTDVRTPRSPVGNYIIIALNVLVFLLTDMPGSGGGFGAGLKADFALDGARPSLHQYLTYQFLHGDLLHLAGNMLFLWIFGNAVCDRMGDIPYILFYLAGGVFAGVAFTLGAENPIVGASGAIAAVTTAFLALFPRVHVTMLVWFMFIFTLQVPSLVVIVFKIILWDNIVAPSLDPAAAASNVAYSAHLGGYAFGFVVAAGLLGARALPRNPFDILSLWSRQARRQGWTLPGDVPTGRPVQVREVDSRPLEAIPLTPVEQLREEIGLALADRDAAKALAAYEQLRALDAEQVLSARAQIEVANYLAEQQRYAEAADAYEAFITAYPTAAEIPEVRLFLGLLANRYLQDYARAVRHLRAAVPDLRQPGQRTLASDELQIAEARLATMPPSA